MKSFLGIVAAAAIALLLLVLAVDVAEAGPHKTRYDYDAEALMIFMGIKGSDAAKVVPDDGHTYFTPNPTVTDSLMPGTTAASLCKTCDTVRGCTTELCKRSNCDVGQCVTPEQGKGAARTVRAKDCPCSGACPCGCNEGAYCTCNNPRSLQPQGYTPQYQTYPQPQTSYYYAQPAYYSVPQQQYFHPVTRFGGYYSGTLSCGPSGCR